MDAGYAPFVNLLQQTFGNGPSLPNLSDDTVYGALAFYFGSLPIEIIPTFSRVVSTSPYLWSNLSPGLAGPGGDKVVGSTWRRLLGVQAAVRQASRTKLESLKKVTPPGFIFAADVGTPLRQWTDAIRSGVEFLLLPAGPGVGTALGTKDLSSLHAGISVLSGLALGVDDVLQQRTGLDLGGVDVSRVSSAQGGVQKDLMRLCAEAVAVHVSLEKIAWGKEFVPSPSRTNNPAPDNAESESDPVILSLC